MELALNLAWFILSTAAFSAVARWSVRQPAGAASRRRQIVVGATVLCLVALLFPIISISDDMSHDVLLAEASVKRRASHDEDHHQRITTAVAMAVISALILIFNLMPRGFSAAECAGQVVSRACVSLPARAPPQRIR
jgi:hypothetical protein